MKRKGTVPDEEQDKKKSAVGIAARTRSATRAAARFKLTDFADEILIQVYSFLNFKERQITRRTCHRLLEFVDKSTPGAKNLSINIYSESSRTPGNRPFVLSRGRRDFPDSVSVDINLFFQPPRYGRSQGDFLGTLRSRLPPLRSIRPKKLSLRIDDRYSGVSGYLAVLLQLLAERQVVRSVSSIDLRHYAPFGPEPDLRQACSTFDLASQSGVQCLTLGGRSHLVLSLPLYLPRLVSLCLDLQYKREEETRRGLAQLTGHPSLRELRFRSLSYPLRLPVFDTLAAFSSLRKLEICFCYLNASLANHFSSFGSMLRGMTSLEYLGILATPDVEFWEYLGGNNITSNSLRELVCRFTSVRGTVEGLKAMVQCLPAFVPNLATLYLDDTLVGLFSCVGAEDSIRALSALCDHPTLAKLHFRPAPAYQKSEEKALIPRLQQALGTRVKVVSERLVRFPR